MEDPPESADVSEIIAAVGDELYSSAKIKKIHLNVTDHRVISRILFISKTFLDSLPVDLRRMLLKEGRRIEERKLSVQAKIIFLKEAAKRGIVINKWTTKQKRESKILTKSFYNDFADKFSDKSLLDYR